MHLRRSCYVALLCLAIATVRVDAAPDPRTFLTKDWYVVEVIAVERSQPIPTSERLVHGVVKRVLPADLRVMSFSEEEQQLFMFNTNNATLIFDEDDHPRQIDLAPGVQEESSGEFANSESIGSGELASRSIGCWLHARRTDLSRLRNDSNFPENTHTFTDGVPDWSSEPNSSVGTQLQSDSSIAESTSPRRTRNENLPSWLPDEWETFEVIVSRLSDALGLCNEDIASLIEFDHQASLEKETEESSTEPQPLSIDNVRRAFQDFEEDLIVTTGERKQTELLVMRNVANQLRNNGYRVIDHVAWHQDAAARGTEPSFLVQLGNMHANRLYEIEGTINLSLARYLHLSVDLWMNLPSSPGATRRTVELQPRILFYLMKESRRLALGEIHYFDHPKFSILVQIRRVPVPSDLITLIQELDSAF